MAGNIGKLYLFRACSGFGKGLLIPIIVLYFLHQGLTLATFTIFWAMLNAATILFEIPTGIIADRFSRKWSICAGALFDVAAILILQSTTNLRVMPLGFMSWGLSQALLSGAVSALLYDSLKAENREAEFQKTTGTATSINQAGTVVGAALSGILVNTGGYMWPWLIAAIVHVIGAAVTLRLQEPPFLAAARAGEKATTLRAHWLGYVGHLRVSGQILWGQRGLLALVFLSLVGARMFILVERPFAQPFLSSFGYDAAQIGYFHSLFFLITAIFAKNSHRISSVDAKNERYTIVSVALFGLAALLVMVNAWQGSVLVVGLLGIYLMKGLFTPLLETSLNRRLASEQRASVLSMASMGNNLLGIALGPLFGYLADAFSLAVSLFIFQWTFGPLLVIGILWVWVALGRTALSAPDRISYPH